MEGTPNPSEVAKNYRAGYYTCTRYDIDDDGKGAYIVSKENIETKQKDETVTTETTETKNDVMLRQQRSQIIVTLVWMYAPG